MIIDSKRFWNIHHHNTAHFLFKYLRLRRPTPEQIDHAIIFMRHTFGWLIPRPSMLKDLKEFAPIVEIGAGKGYWANLATEGEYESNWYHCYDTYIPPPRESYYKIHKGDGKMMHTYPPTWNLFVCCPQYRSDHLLTALRAFEGKYLIYAGNIDFRLNFDPETDKELDNWEIIKEVPIIDIDPDVKNWFRIYQRKVWKNNYLKKHTYHIAPRKGCVIPHLSA